MSGSETCGSLARVDEALRTGSGHLELDVCRGDVAVKASHVHMEGFCAQRKAA